ncbi:2-dehydro-3-deoxyphosphooctonate aldolase [Flavobacterium agricola]|uniref:2-dehydro-3-deoxyphosphooctonate aldolase n=1 Tax=Flavobacterium agricola TaxID=2870839 RepID=A0ABY6M1W9_9FLAO|nr:2-dehydro-3-deoxyphosphooctonate aldolase [Flavobacterium agricola]UYW02431.1 2-dehydro-3-deoxyphosphooctonate aldolase [Flavobacterium agricola]
MIKNAIYLLFSFFIIGCVSTKSTLKNVDYKATKPKIEKGKYVITEYANDPKYGYNKEYPINIGFANLHSEEYFVKLFFNGLTNPEGDIFSYEKIETCCPFPSNHNKMGVGLLHKYRVTFNNGTTKDLYINLYEKGEILCPNGFKILAN